MRVHRTRRFAVRAAGDVPIVWDGLTGVRFAPPVRLACVSPWRIPCDAPDQCRITFAPPSRTRRRSRASAASASRHRPGLLVCVGDHAGARRRRAPVEMHTPRSSRFGASHRALAMPRSVASAASSHTRMLSNSCGAPAFGYVACSTAMSGGAFDPPSRLRSVQSVRASPSRTHVVSSAAGAVRTTRCGTLPSSSAAPWHRWCGHDRRAVHSRARGLVFVGTAADPAVRFTAACGDWLFSSPPRALPRPVYLSARGLGGAAIRGVDCRRFAPARAGASGVRRRTG